MNWVSLGWKVQQMDAVKWMPVRMMMMMMMMMMMILLLLAAFLATHKIKEYSLIPMSFNFYNLHTYLDLVQSILETET